MRACLVALAVLGTAYFCASARALDSDDEAYDAAINTAVAHYRNKEWQAAREAFARAHALRPSARTFRGLGLSAYYAQDDVAAAAALQSALEDARNALDPEQRAQVTDLLERIRPRVAHVHVQAKPETVAIQVDGAAIAGQQGHFVIPGRHRLLVSAPGFVDFYEEFEVSGGQRMSLRVVLEPKPVPKPAVVTAPGEAAGAKRLATANRVRQERHEGGFTVEPWMIAGAAAGVVAVVAVAFALATDDELAELQRRCDQLGCTPETRDRIWAESPIETYEMLTNVALATAIAGTAASVTLFVTLDSDDDDGSARSPRSTRVGLAGVRLSGRF